METDQKFQEVVKFVTEKHSNQFRKSSNLPYIVHPMAVLSQISDWGIKSPTAHFAALAHDVLEDCDVTERELEKIIGEEATDIVKELSFFPNKSSVVSVRSQKEDYMDSFKDSSIYALMIKLADRCCNTHDFYVSGSDYTIKYWHKADDLFNAFDNRKEEIICFLNKTEKMLNIGEKIYTRAKNTMDFVESKFSNKSY